LDGGERMKKKQTHHFTTSHHNTTHHNTLQHITTHYNTTQHITTHYNTSPMASTNTLQQSPSVADVCLVLIDLQTDFYTRIPEVASAFPQLPANVAQLIKHCRSQSIDIVHVRASYNSEQCQWWEVYHTLRPHMKQINDGRGQIVTPEPETFAAEEGHEPVIIKHTFDGYVMQPTINSGGCESGH
jgi:hypothetical protein